MHEYQFFTEIYVFLLLTFSLCNDAAKLLYVVFWTDGSVSLSCAVAMQLRWLNQSTSGLQAHDVIGLGLG